MGALPNVARHVGFILLSISVICGDRGENVHAWLGNWRRTAALASLFVFLVPGFAAEAQGQEPSEGADRTLRRADQALLPAGQWEQLDRSVDRGLSFLSRAQQSDGSFPTMADGQPGVTSLCIMAFLARGHQPGKGPYGRQIERAIDYVLDMQDQRVGAIMADRWVGDEVIRITDGRRNRSFAGNYNHGIAGVMLGEVYGMTSSKRHERIREAILKALDYTRRQQIRPKSNPDERGGWRYVHTYGENDSDLSVTAWQLMFLRSARNAEFHVPKEWIHEAMKYVHRSFDSEQKGFVYALSGSDHYCSRAMVGAGIVCLALGGEHETETTKLAGDWILACSFEPYRNFSRREDRYHYGAFYCTQAMFQLGGAYWHTFFPKLMRVLTNAQHADGSWDFEVPDDGEYGNLYTTALAVLTLATPYQLLPIYQR
jgi:hypothetical protein